MYTFDNKVIHDEKAMWSLELSFMVKYESLKAELIKIETDRYVMQGRDILFEYNNPSKFKKIVKEYKDQVAFMESVFKRDIKNPSEGSYVNYLSEDK